mmetsp:Transcript_30838/g.38145  ORF Transcript_30838/g.38145 Transcript_30838/m.38145 type:complete len:114 (+) Transcript_30838:35-376(+)
MLMDGVTPPIHNVKEYCTNYNFTSGSSTSNVIMMIFVSLFTLSVLGLLFIASTILYSKKLQSHPQPMIAWICVAEACMSYNALMEVINPVSMICYFKIYKILSTCLFRYNSND